MASGNTGTIYANKVMPGTDNLKPAFYWNVTNVNPDAGTATVNYKIYISGSENIKYRVFGTGDRNYLNINGSKVWGFSSVGRGTKSDPYKMYCRENQHRMTPYYASPPDWTFSGWTIWYGVLQESSFTLHYDDEGNASFSVYGAFQCFYGAGNDKRVYINDSVTVTKIDRHSKVALKKNGAWDDKAGTIWHKESGTWKKRQYYRKESGTWKKK